MIKKIKKKIKKISKNPKKKETNILFAYYNEPIKFFCASQSQVNSTQSTTSLSTLLEKYDTILLQACPLIQQVQTIHWLHCMSVS